MIIPLDRIINKTFLAELSNNSLKEIVSSSISGTYVLLSGFLLENEMVITSSLVEAGLQYISTSQRGDWILVLAKMP
jgi:ribosomal protein L11 methylase PrmA